MVKISLTIHVTLHDGQISPVVVRGASPDHDAATAIPIMLLEGCRMVPLPMPSQNTLSLIRFPSIKTSIYRKTWCNADGGVDDIPLIVFQTRPPQTSELHEHDASGTDLC